MGLYNVMPVHCRQHLHSKFLFEESSPSKSKSVIKFTNYDKSNSIFLKKSQGTRNRSMNTGKRGNSNK